MPAFGASRDPFSLLRLERVLRVRLRAVDRVAQPRQGCPESILNCRLSMDQPYRPKLWRMLLDLPQPADQLRSIRVRTIPIDHLHARMERDFVSEDLQRRTLLDNSPAEGVLCLKSHHKYGIPRIA